MVEANSEKSAPELGRDALTAFVTASEAPDARRAAIIAALRQLTPAADDDAAGVYGALHALAPMLDALRSQQDMATAIASRADRFRAVGASLLEVHGGALAPWPLVRIDMDPAGAGIRGGVPRLLLRPQKAYGVIRIDAVTTLCNVPAAVWSHSIGEDALMEVEFAAWRTRATAQGPDVQQDKDALIRRIAWLCRVAVVTRRLLDAA